MKSTERRRGKMKRIGKSTVVLVAVALAFAPIPVKAFNPATHLYIAERVFADCGERIDLWYGSIAPDLALYVAIPENWITSFNDTHYDYMDLVDSASSPVQKAFAQGWLSHNEEWGADYYAHIRYSPPGISLVHYNEECGYGYVTCKAAWLAALAEIPPDLAHFAIEVAVDLLLKNIDPKVGAKLLVANLFRSWQDRLMLTKVLVWQEKRTDWGTLAATEVTFRNLVHRYAMALALPSPNDQEALAELGAQLAGEMFGVDDVSPEEIAVILETALELCEADYITVINFTVDQLKEKIGHVVSE